MSDDLVTRLREAALEGIWDFTQASFDMQNAADEIERLRADRDLWVKVADDLYLIHDDCPKDLDAPQANSHQWNEIINNYFEAKGID